MKRSDKRRKAAPNRVPVSVRQTWKRAKRVDQALLLDLGTFIQGLDEYKDSHHAWWLLHGANCILSDYQQGLWAPIFEGIYSDDAVLPDFDSAFDRVMGLFWGQDSGWVGSGQAAAAWLIQKPESLYLYYLSALRQLGEDFPGQDPEVLIRKPHNPTVWKILHLIKIQILAGEPLSTNTPETTDDRDLDPAPAPRGAEVQPEDVQALGGGGPAEAVV